MAAFGAGAVTVALPALSSAQLPINHNVSDDADKQAEVVVAVQPNDASRVIAGSNPFGPPSLRAWISDNSMRPKSVVVRDVPTTVRLPTSEGGGTVTPNIGADPVVLADREGTLWYLGLTRENQGITGRDCPPGIADTRLCHIFINRIAAGTTTFQPQTTAIPAAAGVFQDKPHAAIDNWPGSPHYGRIYVVWSPLPSPGRIVISLCDTRLRGRYNPARCDDPDNWSVPAEIGNPGFFGAVAPAPNGDVYVAYRDEPGNEIEMNRCLAAEGCTQGANWNERATVRTLASVNGGSLLACSIPPEPDNPRGFGVPFGLEASPDGRVYVAFSDLRSNGTTACTGSPTDQSVDSFIAVGQPSAAQFPNLQATVRLADDAFSEQNYHFFPSLTVDPSTGSVESHFYSTKLDPTRTTVDVFYVRSTDGGLTYSPMKRISTEATSFSGTNNSPDDYMGSDSAQGRFFPAWTDFRQGSPDQELYMLTRGWLGAIPGSLSFRSTNIGRADSPRRVKLSNRGTVSASFGCHRPPCVPPFPVKVVGPDPEDFFVSADSCTSRTLAARATCSITVYFSPTARGARTAVLRLFSRTLNTTDVPLSGTARKKGGRDARPARFMCGTVTRERVRCGVVLRPASRRTSQAWLTRQGSTYARTQRLTARGRLMLTLRPRRALRPGAYTLILVTTDRSGRRIAQRHTVRLR